MDIKKVFGTNRIHISEGEVSFSETHSEHYYLYRLYNFNSRTGDADFYIQPGAINRDLLSPTNYVF